LSISPQGFADAWFQCVYHIFEKGFEYTSTGQFQGQKRLEYDYIVIHITHRNTTLIPISAGYNVHLHSMDYVEQYLES